MKKLKFAQYFVAIVVSLVDKSAGGSCRAAKLCCQGRDSGCVIQKVSPNAIIESPKDKPCYCDHACLKLNDCCNDFRETCSGEFYSITNLTPITIFNYEYTNIRIFIIFYYISKYRDCLLKAL